MGQDDPTSRNRPSRPAGSQKKDASKTPTVPMRPVRRSDPRTAPTVPMRPVRRTDSHSAPTVPMEPVRLPVEPSPEPKTAPKPGKTPAAHPSPPAVASGPGSTGSRAAIPKGPPAPSAPSPERAAPPVPDEPKPLAGKPHELKPPPPERRSASTSVMLKSNRLHQLLDQTARAAPSKSDAALLYDGLTPAKGVTVIDPGRIVIAPLQSFPGQRTVTTTQSVINQYAVVANPRYLVRNVDPREAGALFVFDVMSSLNTTLGRAFLASASGNFRPGTIAELWRWLSETALSVGWRVVEGQALWNALGQGLPVIAMAETAYGRRVAVAEPGFPGAVSKPRLASAHEPRGQGQTPEDIFGTSVARYMAHD
jgi:hypothetical protein